MTSSSLQFLPLFPVFAVLLNAMYFYFSAKSLSIFNLPMAGFPVIFPFVMSVSEAAFIRSSHSSQTNMIR